MEPPNFSDDDNTPTSVEYPDNDTLTADLTDGEQPASSLDYVIGNNSSPEAGEVPTGFDYPENSTDHRPYNFTDVDPLGRGASLASEVNGSANAVLGSNDYYDITPQEEEKSEFEDVLDKTWTSAKGGYNVEGKILYAPGDYTWKLYLNIDHTCDNGTLKVSMWAVVVGDGSAVLG